MTRAQDARTVRSTVLVIEDERPMLRALRSLLVGQGYAVLEAATGEKGVAAAFERQPTALLLDLGLPDMDGLEVARRVRAASRVPIIVISVRSTERDIVDALDQGANDYLTKPFRERELFARLRAAIRNASPREPAAWTVGTLQLDPDTRRVTVDGREVKLSATEQKLLVVLLQNAGSVVSHERLLREVWGPAYVTEVGYLRVYMHHLREKLEPEPARPRFLLTESGIGYRLATT